MMKFIKDFFSKISSYLEESKKPKRSLTLKEAMASLGRRPDAAVSVSTENALSIYGSYLALLLPLFEIAKNGVNVDNVKSSIKENFSLILSEKGETWSEADDYVLQEAISDLVNFRFRVLSNNTKVPPQLVLQMEDGTERIMNIGVATSVLRDLIQVYPAGLDEIHRILKTSKAVEISLVNTARRLDEIRDAATTPDAEELKSITSLLLVLINELRSLHDGD